MDYLVKTTGIEDEPLRLLLGLLAGYPLAFLWNFLPASKPTLRHLFSASTGLGLSYFAYGEDTLHSVVCVNITWLILTIFSNRKTSLFLSTVFNFSYLMVAYVFTATTEKYTINWTTAHCVLTLRIIGICFDVNDYKLNVKDNDQKKNCVDLPTAIEFYGYIYHFGGFFVGPQYPYERYNRNVNGELVPSPRPSNGIFAAFMCTVQAAFYLGLSQVLTMYFNPVTILTEGFLEPYNLFERLLWIALACKVFLCKYYGVWKLAETPNIISGLGYNGIDEETKNHKWDAVTNILLWKVETAYRLNEIILGFNINTNQWVKLYVFKRLRFLGSKELSQLGALLFLAAWHGFYPGYFLCFFMEFLDMQAEYTLVSWFKPVSSVLYNPKANIVVKFVGFLARLVCMVITSIAIGYGAVPFILLTFEKSMSIWGMLYHSGFIAVALVLALKNILNLLKPKKSKKKQ